MKQPGKRFERKVKKSLDQLQGIAYRIEDGGQYAKNQQPGDFWYMNEDVVYLIECKATHLKSLPLSQIADHQIESLLKHRDLSPNHRSLLMIHYYQDRVAGYMTVEELLRFIGSSDRKSIPQNIIHKFDPLNSYWDMSELDEVIE